MAGLTDNEAAQLARDFQTVWATTNAVRGTRRELRQRQLDPPMPPGWGKNIHIKHKTYEIDDAVRVLRNRLLGALVSILVFAKSRRADKQQAASRIRAFLKKVWLDFNRGYPSPHFLGTDAQVADGAWAAHLVWDQDWIEKGIASKDIDAYLKGAGVPFSLETPDLLNVYPEFNRKKMPRRVVTIEKVAVGDLLGEKYKDADGTEYFLGFDKDTQSLSKSAEPQTADDFWTAEFRQPVVIVSLECEAHVHRVLIEGVKDDKQAFGLGKWDNLFKRPGWVFMPGDFSNSTDMLERWKPLILGMHSMGQEVNMLRSARLNSGMLVGLPRIMLEPDPEKGFGKVGEDHKAELIYNEDGTVVVPEGYKVKSFELPTGTDSILENALASVEMELARFKPAPALRGMREEGVSSGYQQALIAEAAMTDLDPALEMQSAGIADILRLVLDGAKAIKEVTDGKIDTLYVRNLEKRTSENGRSPEVLELKADEIDDFEITIRQSSMSPTSRIGMIEEGRRMRKAGEIDNVEMYESYFGYEDGAEMEKRAIEQQMFDAVLPETIGQVIQVLRQDVVKAGPQLVGPTGEPITSPQPTAPPGSVPAGAAAPGMDATLAQPSPPGPQPVPVSPAGGPT